MNEQSPDQPEGKLPDDLVQQAIESIASDTVPDGPPPALDVATLRTLAELDQPPRRSFPFVPRSRIMKFAAVAACLMVVMGLLKLWTPTVDSSAAFGDIFSEALKLMREARSMSYVEEMIVQGKESPVIIKEFIAEDGRSRSEIGPGVTTTRIFDKAGELRLTLLDLPNPVAVRPDTPKSPRPHGSRIAFIGDPKKERGSNPSEGFRTWLQHLKLLGDRPQKVLGKEELDGKQVTGFVVTQGKRTFTMWIDSVTGIPVRIEFDGEFNGAAARVTMKDFHFHQALDESLFSFDVPRGYKIYVPPEDGKIEPPAALEPASSTDLETASPTALELAWSIMGHWSGVTRIPESPAVYALQSGGELSEVNSGGEVVGTSKIGDRAGSIRTANLIAGQKSGLLTFGPGSAVDAYTAEGKHLWSYPDQNEAAVPWGIQDVWAADLDGDGRDEIIIGYAGGVGLHVLDPMGTLLWKNTDRANIWHVTSGNVDNDPRPEVLTTAVDGKVHIYDWQGKYLRHLDPGFYSTIVRWWQPSQMKPIQTQHADEFGLIIVAGGGRPKSRLAALDSLGHTQWSSELSAPVTNSAIAVDKPWLALSFQDGNVRVVDLAAGKEIAHVGGQGGGAGVAWLPTHEGPPLLVISTRPALQAYRLTATQP